MVRFTRFCLLLGPPGFNWCFSFAPGFNKLNESVESSFLIHQSGNKDLFVCP